VLWAPTSARSSLVTTAYASVVTAPFAFDTSTNTLTISNNATSKQAAEYLFKLAYDNATDAFWRTLNHTPATLTASGSISFGAMNIVVSEGILSGDEFVTTGTATTTGTGTITAPYQDINNAGSISVSGVAGTDTVQFRKASDDSLIASRTGEGSFAVSPANVGISAYFVRLAGSNTVMSTITTPVTLVIGVNDDVPLFAGAEVQVAQAAIDSQLAIINEGVQKASLLIPHTTDF
jgi:hypothetical protein